MQHYSKQYIFISGWVNKGNVIYIYIQTMWYIYTMGYYWYICDLYITMWYIYIYKQHGILLSIKIKNILLHVAEWMNLQIVMLGEMSVNLKQVRWCSPRTGEKRRKGAASQLVHTSPRMPGYLLYNVPYTVNSTSLWDLLMTCNNDMPQFKTKHQVVGCVSPSLLTPELEAHSAWSQVNTTVVISSIAEIYFLANHSGLDLLYNL